MSATTVQSFYIAYYGRPADPSGLDFWVGRVAAEGSFDSLVAAFGTSAEATELFADKTDTQKINAVYQSTFGRDADAEGLAFYSAGLADGTFSLYDISKRILDGATTGDDAAIVANKITVAQAFTAELASDPEAAAEYVGIAATTSAKALVSAVDATAASVTTATAQISVILSITTSTLTTGVDTIAGTAGRDKISGGATALSSTDTLQATDKIDGGAGNDSLTLALTKNFGGFTVGTGYLKNVETVNLSNSSSTVTTFTGTAVTGVNAYNVSGPISVTGIDSLATTINLSGNTALSSVRVGFDDALVTGSSDSVSLGVSGLGKASTQSTLPFTGTSQASVTIEVPGVETLTLRTDGTNNVTLAGDKAKAVVATGTGSLTLEGVSSTVKTYDGSANSGDQIVTFTSATNITSVKTSGGNDQIWTQVAGEFRADAVIDGGAGEDRLVFAAGTHTGAYALNGVETIALGTNAAVTMALASSEGLANIVVGGTTAAVNSITNIGAKPIAVVLQTPASGDVNSALTVENTAAATLTAAFNSGVTSGTVVDDVTFSKATSVAVNIPSGIIYTPANQLTATKATEVTLAGGGTYTSATVDVPVATKLTFDQTGSSRTWTVTVDETDAVTTPLLTDLVINAQGTLTLTEQGGTAFNNLERLEVNTGKYFDADANATPWAGLGNLTKLTSAVLGGTQDASQVALANLGGSNPYGLTITASGLKAGLALGDLAVGTGQTIAVDLKGLTTTSNGVVIGVINATDTNSTLSIDATGAAAEADFTQTGAVTARNITVDATGSSFANFTVGGAVGGVTSDITGTNVTIKTPTAPTAAALGHIKASSSVTVHGPSTAAINTDNDVLITASSSSTALTVDLMGGLSQDEFLITGGAAQTSITVTGDLKGDATDLVTVTSTTSTATGGQTINVSGLSNSTTVITAGGKNDSIFGSAGKDTIKGGLGADVFDISQGGNDVITYTDARDTGTIGSSIVTTSLFSSAGVARAFAADATISATDYVSTSGFDKIIGFGLEDRIQTNARVDSAEDPAAQTSKQTLGALLGVGTSLQDGDPLAKFTGAAAETGTSATDGTTNAIDMFIQGTYSSSNNRFTFSNSGGDTLYVFDQDGEGAGTSLGAVVLVGYVLGADGVITSNTGLIGAALP